MRCAEYLQSYQEKLCQEMKGLQGQQMPAFTKEGYEDYFLTGNRVPFERVYFGRRAYLTDYGVWAIMTCDRKSLAQMPQVDQVLYLEQLLAVIREILCEPTWVLPAHGSMDYFEGKQQSIDLFASETAGTLAEILALIQEHPVLLENTACKLQYEELKQLFFKEFQTRIWNKFVANDPCEWWEYGDMNWSSVCAGNIGIAAYYLTEMGFLTKKEMLMVLHRTARSMESYLSAMGQEGVCTEGVGYYKYGMEYFLAWHELAMRVREEEQENIWTMDFHPLALFLQNVSLGNGKYVNFSDCTMDNPMKMGMLAYLSSLYGDVRVPTEYVAGEDLILTEQTEILGGKECHRFAGALRDYLWVKQYGEHLQAGGESMEISCYPEHMWFVRRFGQGTSLACKGGHNDEPHNHNDVGSFLYLVDGEEILCDLGSGEYVKDYFNEHRYEFLCTSSYGHNVPLLGNRADGQQAAGKEYRATVFAGTRDRVTIQYGAAYGLEEGEAVCREITWDEAGNLSIVDMVHTGNIWEEGLLTRIRPEIRGMTAFLSMEGAKSVVIRFDEGMAEGLQVEELEFAEHDGYKALIYRISAKVKGDRNQICISIQE